ncbi:MAG: glycerophosphodiester phosphodiesterase [Lachnospiraceae bacterium]|nr:glycerophosphodiester phosphodiesterase [Lachnospiraceae bacterium]
MRYLMITLFVLLVYLILIAPRFPKRKVTREYMGKCYAHRGLFSNENSCPENSLPAFTKAVESGYGIEMDVQITKDNKLIVFHDNTLSRMCGIDVNVRDKTYRELCELSLLATDCKIPLLSEVLKMVNGSVPLLIEIKLPVFSTLTCRLVDEVLRNYKGKYCIESFNTLALLWYRIHRPDIVRGQLSGNLTRPVADGGFFLCFLVKYLLTNILARPDFISFCYKDTFNLSYLLNRYIFRVPTFAWTIDSPKAYADSFKKFDSFIFEGFIA